jgi:hypothetical protein
MRTVLLHKCDIRLCGNPAHLFAGTHRDNWEDSVQKRRQSVVLPGERNRNAKLTTDNVRAIRRSAARVADLVRQFKVDASTIRQVIRRQTWRHVPDDAPEIIRFHGVMDRPAPAMLRSA